MAINKSFYLSDDEFPEELKNLGDEELLKLAKEYEERGHRERSSGAFFMQHSITGYIDRRKRTRSKKIISEPPLGDVGKELGMESALDIDSLEAGPETDRLVAENVMGIVLENPCTGEWECEPWPGYCEKCKQPATEQSGDYHLLDHAEQPRPYSSYIGIAWEVMEKIKRSGFASHGFFIREIQYHHGEPYIWQAGFIVTGNWGENEYSIEGEAPTAPLAIVRAALKAALDHPFTAMAIRFICARDKRSKA